MTTEISRAFTTRIPLAVLIVLGIKGFENRSQLPTPTNGTCGMSCSKTSDEREYTNFLRWAVTAFKESTFSALPMWEQVCDWRGKMVAVMDYEASEQPGDFVWNEGYRYWWKLSNVRLLEEPFSVRGNVGMWDVG